MDFKWCKGDKTIVPRAKPCAQGPAQINVPYF